MTLVYTRSHLCKLEMEDFSYDQLYSVFAGRRILCALDLPEDKSSVLVPSSGADEVTQVRSKFMEKGEN